MELQPPTGRGFVTPLRHYQKQSVAFMVDTERTFNRGGWLSDEVGMGKSAVVLGLVSTNPVSPKGLATAQQIQTVMNDYDEDVRRETGYKLAHEQRLTSERAAHFGDVTEDSNHDEYRKLRCTFAQIKRQEDQTLKSQLDTIQWRRVKVKATVILTSCSLLGQWEDEMQKHAPGLVVKTFHGSRAKSKQINLKDRRAILGINDVDIILSTATFTWPAIVTSCLDFHRVVQDESHLFIKGGVSAKIDSANAIKSSLRWGVTATPATSGASDLSRQLIFLRGSSSIPVSEEFQPLNRAISQFQYGPSEETMNTLVDLLKTFMVRHTKSQRIQGAEALALPPSTTSTILLSMSADEDRAFNKINTSAGTFARHLSEGAQRVACDRDFVPQMPNILKHTERRGDLSELVGATQRRYNPERLSKIVALRQDLANLRRSEAQLRAVVFTQHLDVHDACVRGLQRDGFDVYQFSGSTGAAQRDSAIRNFQNTSNGRAAVFVITLRSGNVGITLTAASRVYLLEPSIDPAVEVQAAGRIHRLGQNKPCHVVKFVFRNSYENNTIALHQEISSGRVTIVDGWLPPQAMKILGRGIRRFS